MTPPEREGGGLSVDVAIFEQFRAMARMQGSAIALDAGGETLSYAQLLQRAESLGEAILRVSPGAKLVALALQAAAWTPLALLACLRNGTLCLTLDPRDPLPRRLDILADAKPCLIVTDAQDDELVATGIPHLSIQDVLSAPRRPFAVPASASVHAPALLIYTSGSTGTPKGVVLAQHGVLERVRQEALATSMTAQDVVAPLCSLSTIAGCREMLCALLTGARLRLDRWSTLGVREIGEVIRSSGATVIYAVPSLARLLLTAEVQDRLTTVRALRMGGEAVRRSDVEAARAVLPRGATVEVSYSSTEAPGSSWTPSLELAPDEAEVAIGRLWPGCDYAIVDASGGSAAPGGAGELILRSPFVALGHWRAGHLDTSGFVAERGGSGGRIWPTGDWVREEEGGLLRHLGRRDRQRKIHGLRVDLGGLEAGLRVLPGVAEAIALVTVEGELAVFVTGRPGQPAPSIVEVGAAVRASSPHGVQPARVHGMQTVPRLLSGKIDFRALETEDAARREALTNREEPEMEIVDADPVLVLVRTAWRALLPQGRGDEQSFEEAGGDSLTLLNLVLQLEKGLGRPLPLERFQPSMSAHNFATVISALSVATPPTDGRATASAPRPRIFFFPGMHGDVPASARFRARLEPDLEFVALRYPELQSIAAAFPTLEGLGRVMADEIEAAQPMQPLRLLGYSLGGAVAFEAAGELVRRGRDIRFVGILDTSLQREERPVGLRLERMKLDPSRRLLIAQRNLCRRLSRFAAAHRRGSLLLWALNKAPLSPKTRALMVLEAEGELRVLTLRAWAREPRARLALGATLFRSEQWRDSTAADLGWADYFERLDIVDFDGGHVQCLDEPFAAANAARLVDALNGADDPAYAPVTPPCTAAASVSV